MSGRRGWHPSTCAQEAPIPRWVFTIGPRSGDGIQERRRVGYSPRQRGRESPGLWPRQKAPVAQRHTRIHGREESGIPDAGAWLATAPIQTGPGWESLAATGLSTQRLALGLKCRANPCLAPVPGDQPKYVAWSAFRRIVVTVRDDTPPVVSSHDVVPTGWIGAAQRVYAFTATDNVGVMWLEARLDGQRISYSERNCFPAGYNTLPAPCSASAMALLSASVATSTLAEGAHTLTVSAGDEVGNQKDDKHPFVVDRSSPAAPRGLGMVGSGGWHRTNGFDVAWTNPPEHESAPVQKAHYELCPAANRPYDESGCVSAEQSAAEIASLAALRVPDDGSWTLHVSLEDAAGNHDPERRATLPGLQLDSAPPELAFEPVDPGDPARIASARRTRHLVSRTWRSRHGAMVPLPGRRCP